MRDEWDLSLFKDATAGRGAIMNLVQAMVRRRPDDPCWG